MIQQFQFWVKTLTKIQAVLCSVQHYLQWPRYVNNLRIHWMINEYRKCRDRKMAEEHVNMECISLHGCIRNTPSDTEGLAEHQLRVGKSPWPLERNIQIHAKFGRMKGEVGKRRVSRTVPAHGRVGDLKQWSVPLIRETVRDTGEAFGAVGECRKCTHTQTSIIQP